VRQIILQSSLGLGDAQLDDENVPAEYLSLEVFLQRLLLALSSSVANSQK
jgi:hypothetical protein